MADPYFKFVTAQLRAPTPGLVDLNSSFPAGWLARPVTNLRGNSPTITDEYTFLNPYCFKFVKPQVLCLEANFDYTNQPCDPCRFVSSDFTVEGRFYATSISSGVCLMECWTSTNGWQIFVNSNGTIQLKERNLAVTLISLISGALFVINTAHHVALSRTGSVLRLFIDGVKVAETTLLTSHTWTNTPNSFCVGGQWNSRVATFDLEGYADDIRITKGISRYTANFTPPVATDFDTFVLGRSGNQYVIPDEKEIKFLQPEAQVKNCLQLDHLDYIEDMYLGSNGEGDGELYDILSIDGVPQIRKATLIERDSKLIVRQVVSNASGVFHIKGINKNLYYMLIGEDLLSSSPRKNAAIRDFVRCIPKIVITKKPTSVVNGVRSENYEIRAINFTVPVTVTLASVDDVTFSSTTIVIQPQNKVGYFNILATTAGNKTITMTNNINSNNPDPLVVVVA